MATAGEEKVGYSLAKVGTLRLEKNTDEYPDYISIVVCQDKIVVLDWTTYKVQIHGLKDGKVLARSHGLGSGPRDMCLMDAMTICVLQDGGRIKIMSIDSTDMSRVLKTTRTLRLQGVLDEYRGVVRFKDNLVVTGVRQGMMYWCIVSLHDGHVDAIHQICKGDGLWCRVTTKDTIIYISCYAGTKSPDNTGVYGFDILNPSQCKYKYKHQRLRKPTSIVINEDGNIFVCNYGYRDSCIHQLTASCQLVAIFTQGIPWLWDLYALFWDNGRVYGTLIGSQYITVFSHVYQEKWRSVLMDTTEKLGLEKEPGRIFNCDETGWSGMDKPRQKIIGLKGHHTYQQALLISGHTTAHICIAADGRVLPTFLIFEKSFPHTAYKDGVPGNWLFGTSASGYMDSYLLLTWFKDLMKPTLSVPVVLPNQIKLKEMNN